MRKVLSILKDSPKRKPYSTKAMTKSPKWSVFTKLSDNFV